MLTLIRSFPLKKTLLLCALLAFALDFLNSFYFAEYWQAQGLSSRFVSLSLMANGAGPADFDPHFTSELEGMVENTARFMLMIFLLVNAVFYFYLAFRKKWSWQYAFTYTSTASLFCLVTALERPNVSTFYALTNVLAIFLYASLAVVLWSRKIEVQEKGFRLKSAEQ